MSLEQQYYEMLTRTDHPVFAKDFSAVTTADSPFNSIMNRVYAKALVRARAQIDDLKLNSFPQTVNENGIDLWEDTHFGFTKDTKLLSQRVTELLKKLNTKVKMTVGDVIGLAEAITGVTPYVVRNLYFTGWILGESVLGVDTFISGGDISVESGYYAVVFDSPVNSDFLTELDNALTGIEKAGSIHVIVAPPSFWILGESALGIDTILR